MAQLLNDGPASDAKHVLSILVLRGEPIGQHTMEEPWRMWEKMVPSTVGVMA